MNLWQVIKLFGRQPKAYVRRWRKNLAAIYKNPHLLLDFRVWVYDTLNAIEIGKNVYIRQCCKIVGF